MSSTATSQGTCEVTRSWKRKLEKVRQDFWASPLGPSNTLVSDCPPWHDQARLLKSTNTHHHLCPQRSRHPLNETLFCSPLGPMCVFIISGLLPTPMFAPEEKYKTLAYLMSHVLEAVIEMKSELKTGHHRHLEMCLKVISDIFLPTFTLPTKLHPFMGKNF